MSEAVNAQGSVFSILTTAPSTFTVIGEVKDFNKADGTRSVIDVSHLGSTSKEKRGGLRDSGQFTINYNYIPDDAGQVALEAAKASAEPNTFKLVLADGVTSFTFDGIVLSTPFQGAVDGVLSGSATIEITGDWTLVEEDEG